MATVRELLTKIGFVVDKASMKEADRATEKVKQGLEKTGQAGAKAGQEASRGLSSIRQGAESAASGLTGLAGVGARIGGAIRGGLREAEAALDNLRQSARRTMNEIKSISLRKAGANLQEKGGNLASAGLQMSAAGSAMLAPIYFPVREAIQFESAMADVRKVVDFDTPQQFRQMGEDIKELSSRIPMTKEQLAQIVAAGGQSGIERDKLLEFAEAAAKMGVAFDISAEEAGKSMAGWRAGMNLTQEQVVELADQINYLGNNTAAAAPDISNFISRVGALAKGAGMAESATAAFGAAMIAAKTEPEIAATSMQNLILNLQSGESATNRQIEAFAKLGLEAEDVAKRFSENAAATVFDVFRRIKGLEKYRQSSVMEDLLGRESIKGLSKMLQNLDALERNLKMVGDRSQYAGSMQEEFDRRCETTENSLQLLENQNKSTAESIGKTLLPDIDKLSKKLKELSKKIGKFASENREIVEGPLIAVAVVGGLLVAFGTLGILLGGVMTTLGTIGGVISSVFGIESVGAFLGLLSGPVLIALGLLAAAIAFVADNWELVMTWMEPGLAAISAGIENLKEAWKLLQPAIQPVIGLIKFIIGLIGGAIVRAATMMFQVVGEGFATLTEIVKWLAEILGTVAEKIAAIMDFKMPDTSSIFSALPTYENKWQNRLRDTGDVGGTGGSFTTITQNNEVHVDSPEAAAEYVDNAGFDAYTFAAQ